MVLVHGPDFHGGDVVFVTAEDGEDGVGERVHGGHDVAAVVVGVGLSLGSGNRSKRERKPNPTTVLARPGIWNVSRPPLRFGRSRTAFLRSKIDLICP